MAPRRAAAASAKARLAATAGDDEAGKDGSDIENDVAVAAAKKVRSRAPRRTVSGASQTSSRSMRRSASVEADEDEVEGEQDEPVLRRKARVPARKAVPARSRTKRTVSYAEEDKADEDESEAGTTEDITDEQKESLAPEQPAASAIESTGDGVAANTEVGKPGDLISISVDDSTVEAEPEDGDMTTQQATPQARKVGLPEVNTPLVSRVPHTPSAPAPAPTEAKTRLIIHKMVLQDFKSYAGRQEIGPFHKSFSAVVGPNGSGKSNVIDSLLFVFGWRANKMRQGKLSELIHNSASKQSLPSCTVEVWFREIEDLPGPDAFRVVPGSKLVVARTAFRNNTSVYTINSRKSTFTEVTTLLKGRGIDLDHKRFLILQGEVESIAQMPPKGKTEHEEGLLEYLEDIIGTSELKVPIEEAAVKVDECNEQRSVKLERLKFVQKEKQSLENKKKEAEEYLRDQNELTQRQSALWQVYMMECRKQMAVASAAIEKLQGRLEQETEKHSGAKGEVEELTAELTVVTQEYQDAKQELDKVSKELAKFEKASLQSGEKKKHIEAKAKKLEKSIAESKRAISDARATARNSGEEAQKLRSEMLQLEESLEREEVALEAVREGLKDKTQGFTAEIEKKQRELQPWTAKLTAQNNARGLAVEERTLLSSREEQHKERIEAAGLSLRELGAETETQCDAIEAFRKEKADIGAKLADAEKQLERMRIEEQKLRSAAAAARSKAEEAKNASANEKNRSQVLNSLNRQAELGMIKGYHGRLGSLGAIDEKYDIAISTACPGLESIVVDSVESAQACIEHLRKNNLGRANFISLDKLEKGPVLRVQTPENAPRLFDLVQAKSDVYARAFYHQLRDTLVASDPTQASRIAYGATRWRVVTLAGQLIDKSGAMSGGGSKVCQGAMSSKLQGEQISPEKLARLEKERDLAEEQLRGHVKAIHEVQEMAERYRTRAPQIDVDIDTATMAIEISKQRRKESEKQLQRLRSEAEPDAAEAARIAALDQVIAKADSEIEKLSGKTASIESAIEALQEKILEVGGIELRAQKSKVDGIVQMIELNTERITKAEVGKVKAEKDMAKAEGLVAELETSLQSLEADLQEIGAEVKGTGKEANAVQAAVDDARHLVAEKQNQCETLQEQIEAHSDSMNAFRAIEMEIKQKLEDNERSLADNSKRLAHWTDRHASLVLHELDDSEDAKDEEADVALELVTYPEDDLVAIDKESIKAEIVLYEERLSKGHGNLSILEEYRKREQDFLKQARELEATTHARDNAKEQYDELRKERLERFMAGFTVISSKLKEMYQTITLGGNAELELVDSLDPFSEGIIFSVMPPKKSWRNISNLSGGEKTLSSLALVFALHAFKPTPLYVMDEIDAALDFRNVSIVANLIKERTKNAQFVIISLRNNMFELASRLVGIYKTSSMTKSLTIENKDINLIGRSQQPRASHQAHNSQGRSLPKSSTPSSAAPTPSKKGANMSFNESDMLATPLAVRHNLQ
ncbi:RecF/RecN/SMC protein [Tilletiaria anomala UBC 951]|uniref:Structural maintenance of chromosomes protein n=1 Tax=Tilletiaria anomala (strain ATCC 24038 / CBS 436.72 / UBC 951) TaxID=1037660 RepID=A0A066WH42_TILAU|nr:RecF/RecN/SMC protein [Tilletiaria anomala UBC 951]KDN53312.1 RecF/RecN/SMC protein [Tilletiaria anomala UBC 951]